MPSLPAPCPHCAVTMDQVTAHARSGYCLILDQCRRCGGIWCDRWELYPLDAYIQNNIRKVVWALRPEHPGLPDFLKQLRAAIQSSGGEARVELAFLFENRVAPIAEAPASLNWRVSAPVFQELRAHPAVAGTQVETRRMELKEVRRKWEKRG